MFGSLCAAAAVLLVLSGAAKLRHPAASAGTVAFVLRRPSRTVPLVRVLAVAELAVGVAFLARGGWLLAGLVALAFAGFAVVSVVLLAADRRSPCGCFGRSDAPISRAHVLTNVICCGAGIGVALRPVGALGGFAGAAPTVAVVGTMQIVLLAALGYLSLTAVPALAAIRRLADPR